VRIDYLELVTGPEEPTAARDDACRYDACRYDTAVTSVAERTASCLEISFWGTGVSISSARRAYGSSLAPVAACSGDVWLIDTLSGRNIHLARLCTFKEGAPLIMSEL
jgi:hypothetical protein